MKRLLLLMCLPAFVLTAGLSAAGAPAGRVLDPARRIDALKQADVVLQQRTATWRETTREIPDPFFRSHFAPEAEKEPELQVVRTERTDLEILELASAGIQPTGTMMVDGENYLLLGGKRYKRGAVLPATIEGIVYEITLSAIEGKSYTLRLNEQELRRLLK